MRPPPTPYSPEMNSTCSRRSAAPRRSSTRAPRSASLATDDRAVERERAGERAPRAARRASRGWAPSTRTRRSAGRRRRPPPRRRPAARRRAGARAAPSASSARSAAIASTEVWPLRRSTRTSSKTSPPSPTTAAAIESTAISRAEHDGPVRDRGGRRGEGRPGTPCGAARSSVTRSAADSSPISAADRAAGQAGPRDELGARRRTAGVELADDGAQVRAADRLAALPDRLQTHRHRVCVPLF